MCKKAKEIAENWIKASNTGAIQTKYGTNYVYITGESDDKSVPDANKILESWYAYETAYDYFEETLPTREISKFIELHVMFIITILELLVNCYIEYKKTITIHM